VSVLGWPARGCCGERIAGRSGDGGRPCGRSNAEPHKPKTDKRTRAAHRSARGTGRGCKRNITAAFAPRERPVSGKKNSSGNPRSSRATFPQSPPAISHAVRAKPSAAKKPCVQPPKRGRDPDDRGPINAGVGGPPSLSSAAGSARSKRQQLARATSRRTPALSSPAGTHATGKYGGGARR